MFRVEFASTAREESLNMISCVKSVQSSADPLMTLPVDRVEGSRRVAAGVGRGHR